MTDPTGNPDEQMTTFDYRRPDSLVEAFELLSRGRAVALAGGTDLLVAIRRRTSLPEVVVDLKSVAELSGTIEIAGSSLRVGGRVVMSQLTHDEHVHRYFPALAEAASEVGSVQIRNRATLVGNLCNASPAADTAPPLLAYAASVNIAAAGGNRTIPLEDFFLGPGSTVLARGEIVTSVELPIPTTNIGSALARVTRRRGVDLASVSVACAVAPSGVVRFGFGAVGPTPLLAGSTLEELSTDDGWSRLLAVTRPISDVRAGAGYRRAMLQVHSRRTLQVAVEALGAAP
jgi:carbon-monoxide dehydrogenase medium subunit